MKDPAFLFYPGDYLRDTQCLSETVQVAYDRIMCEHMRNICISQAQLKFFTKRLSPDEISELMMVLTEVDGGFQIRWVAESINARKAYSESRRKNRTSKKEKHISKTSETYVQHMENENENEDVVTDEVSYEIISTNSNLNSEEQTKRARPSRRQLFRNSPYANLEDFVSKVYKPEYEDVDLEHYHRAIMAWSDIKDARELRTPEGWIQTAHLWIRKDAEKGKLVKKSAQKVHTVFGAMDQRTIDYLNL